MGREGKKPNPAVGKRERLPSAVVCADGRVRFKKGIFTRPSREPGLNGFPIRPPAPPSGGSTLVPRLCGRPICDEPARLASRLYI